MDTDLLLTRPKSKVGHLLKSSMAILFVIVSTVIANAQAVTEIITDYNGYWKTSTSSINTVKPDNHHNLLSFTYRGNRFSTGVNDALLSSHSDPFTPGQYLALPMQNFNGAVTGNTKIGLGAMVDGVYDGAGAAPSRTLGPYLNDGTRGLDMGTCVANIPAGTMFMSVSNMQAANIGDSIPDIIVTQIADPATSQDFYEFTDVNGVRIGNSLNVALNNIALLGNWVADFYEATGSIVLNSTFTQTQRAIRLWAADFNSFGLNASNIGNIAYFKITLSGSSDIAFVAYNSSTVTVQQVLNFVPGVRTRVPGNGRTEEIKSLSVYPNPAKGFVSFSHPETKAGDKILVYDQNGILLMQTIPASNSTTTKLGIPSLRPGTYHVVYIRRQDRLVEKLIVI